MLVGVPSVAVQDIWPFVKPFIVHSLESTNEYRLDADDIYGQLVRQEAQLWIGGKPLNLVVVTEIYNHPKAKELSIGPIAGELGEGWEEDLQMLMEWGKYQGCTHVGTLGRIGWKRKLGWDGQYTYSVRRL